MTAPVDIMIFSTADWFTRYWTNKQHTAAALSDRGHRVLYLETPGIRAPQLHAARDLRRLVIRASTGVRDLLLGPRQVRANLWVLSPLALPWGRRRAAVRRLNRALLRAALRPFLKRRGFARPEIWTYHPFLLDALAGIDIGPLVYHYVDDITAVPGVDGDTFVRAEQELLKRCDAVFVTARTLEEKAKRHARNVHFFPNVVDAIHFGTAFDSGSEPLDLAAIPHPRLGYHGVLSDFKLDLDLLHNIACQHPDWQLVLIGDEPVGQKSPRLAELRNLPNLNFLGPKDYAELPRYLAGFDVGLLPTLRNRYTISMYPMKYHEYLAAGVPVVSTDLPFAHESRGNIELGNDAEAFAEAIRRQLRRGRLSREGARAAVGSNTWDDRLDRMLAVTGGTL